MGMMSSICPRRRFLKQIISYVLFLGMAACIYLKSTSILPEHQAGAAQLEITSSKNLSTNMTKIGQKENGDMQKKQILHPFIATTSTGNENVHDEDKNIPKIADKPANSKEREKYMLFLQTLGRLGNQMFQYASLYAIAKKQNRVPLFVTNTSLFLPLVFSHIKIPRLMNFVPMYDKYTLQYFAKYDKRVFHLPSKNLQLEGLFQSWKYFKDYEKELRQHLTIQNDIKLKAKMFHRGVSKSFLFKDTTVVGLHVRRGDYLQEMYQKKGFQTAGEDYIIQAIAYFTEKFTNVHFIVCSEANGLQWTHQVLKNYTNVSYSVGHDYKVDFAILSQCNHVIMTVGTYGWWAGWMAGGQVVYYSEPFREGSYTYKRFSKKDFFPPSWIPIP